jgi:hypothetical protein
MVVTEKSVAGGSYNAYEAKAAELAVKGDIAGLAIHLRAVKSDRTLTDAAREKLLRNTLLDMAEIEPDDAARDAVRQFGDYQSKTVIMRNEHGHPEPELAFDVAAAARYAERRWDEKRAHTNISLALIDNAAGIADGYEVATPTEKHGTETAFAETDLPNLRLQRDALLAGMQSGQPVGRLSLITASRLDDDMLYRAVIEKAEARVAIDAIGEVRQMRDQDRALPLLQLAARRPETQSTALLAIGDRVQESAAAENSLFSMLGSAGGASAAAALARSDDAAIIDRLAAVLESSNDDLRRRHAILGLKLARGERASRHLEEFAADPSAPDSLVREAL